MALPQDTSSALTRRPSAVPQLCTGASVLVLLLLSFGLALLIVLAGLRERVEFLSHLALTGFFVFWVSLTGAALLCLIGRRLAERPDWLVASIGFFGVQLVTLFYSLVILASPDWVLTLSFLAVADPLLFVLRNLGISVLASFVLFRHWSLLNRWRDRVAAEARARLDALQARIRPHFLFNTLNTISSLIYDQPDQAEQATMDLADLLRTGLREQGSHTLSDELELVRGYLRIEALRLGERLRVEWSLADDLPLDGQVPALLIQPLVENAIVHGIAARPDGGVLSIRGERVRFGRIRFTIENPLSDEPPSRAAGNRTALDNIHQRLALAFEDGAGLKTTSEDGQFTATLTLPTPTGQAPDTS